MRSVVSWRTGVELRLEIAVAVQLEDESDVRLG